MKGRQMFDGEKEIDFVVTWVDGSDPAWRRQRNSYGQEMGKEAEKRDAGEERYRDWELLPYWFRGVEAFAPWVRRIHFVTWGHLPKWLNVDHEKLHVVRHEDYIPKEYLPVFNSNVLEVYLHRIEGLAEQFVYFNDDMFLIKKADPEDFFRGGKPCDMLAFQPVVANPENPVMSHLFLNNTLVLARHFSKRENVRLQPGSYFKPGYPPLYFFYNLLELSFPLYTGFYTVHGPSPFLKSTFFEVWEKEGEALCEMSANRFRSEKDLTPYLFREWQKLSGNFFPCNVQQNFGYFDISEDNRKLVQTVRGQKKKQICINDARFAGDFEQIKVELSEAFAQILPKPCSFER